MPQAPPQLPQRTSTRQKLTVPTTPDGNPYEPGEESKLSWPSQIVIWCDPVQVRYVWPKKYFPYFRRDPRGQVYITYNENGIPVDLLLALTEHRVTVWNAPTWEDASHAFNAFEAENVEPMD